MQSPDQHYCCGLPAMWRETKEDFWLRNYCCGVSGVVSSLRNYARMLWRLSHFNFGNKFFK
jgi:hypothetical protein